MPLFLTEWLDGPDEFYTFAKSAINPQIQCIPDEDKPGHVKAIVTIFDVNLVKEFIDSLDEKYSEEFTIRFNSTTKYLFDLFKVQDFLMLKLNSTYEETGHDLKETTELITDEFVQFLMDIEFWNKFELPAVYTNLIFYGMIDDPKAVIFFIPPPNDWTDEEDDWVGYTPE